MNVNVTWFFYIFNFFDNIFNIFFNIIIIYLYAYRNYVTLCI